MTIFHSVEKYRAERNEARDTRRKAYGRKRWNAEGKNSNVHSTVHVLVLRTSRSSSFTLTSSVPRIPDEYSRGLSRSCCLAFRASHSNAICLSAIVISARYAPTSIIASFLLLFFFFSARKGRISIVSSKRYSTLDEYPNRLIV